MKFRTDFVTNSSSSSFSIVTAKLISGNWGEETLFETNGNEEALRNHLGTLKNLDSKIIFGVKTLDELADLLIPESLSEDSDYCYADYSSLKKNIKEIIVDISDLHYIEISLCKTLWGEFMPMEFAALYDDVCTHSDIFHIDYKNRQHESWQEGYEYLSEYEIKFGNGRDVDDEN